MTARSEILAAAGAALARRIPVRPLQRAHELLSAIETATGQPIEQTYADNTGGLAPTLWGAYLGAQALGKAPGLEEFGVALAVPHVEI